MGNTNILFHTFWCGRKSNPAEKKKISKFIRIDVEETPFSFIFNW